MARYKTLQSVAHALARSFVAAGSYADSDQAFCHLLAATRAGGAELTVDILDDGATFPLSVPTAFAAACSKFSKGLPGLVASNGSDIRLISAAELKVVLQPSIPADPTVLRGHVSVHARITDDRGRVYTDSFTAPLLCIGERWNAA